MADKRNMRKPRGYPGPYIKAVHMDKVEMSRFYIPEQLPDYGKVWKKKAPFKNNRLDSRTPEPFGKRALFVAKHLEFKVIAVQIIYKRYKAYFTAAYVGERGNV